MSYRYYLLNSNARILADRVADAGRSPKLQAAAIGRRDGNMSLQSVLRLFGFEYSVHPVTGDLLLDECYPEEAVSDPERLLRIVAPFACGRLVWLGEDQSVWRGGFVGGEYVTSDADLDAIP